MAAAKGAPDLQRGEASTDAQMTHHVSIQPDVEYSDTNDEDVADEGSDSSDLSSGQMHSAVGVSMSRAQTFLSAPETPAAAKVAAMEVMGGILDQANQEDVADTDEHGEFGVDSVSNGRRWKDPDRPPPRSQSCGADTKRTTDDTYEISNNYNGQVGESNGLLANIGFPRYISSLKIPIAMKSPFGKDFSVASLGSILNEVRSHSPTRKLQSRSKRATTLATPKQGWASKAEAPTGTQQENAKAPSAIFNIATIIPKPDPNPETVIFEDAATPTNDSTTSIKRPPHHRRATSDQSLHLLRVKSTAESLGDDSRWEHIQGQVNSRTKAIIDSLQDSNFKIPALPSFPTFNIFKPEPARPKNLPERHINGRTGRTSQRPCDSGPTDDSSNTLMVSPKKGAASHLDEALNRLSGDLVVLGGYRGSILRSSKPPHRQLWVPVKVGLNMRKVDLEVGLEAEDEEAMEKTIFPSGMLTHIGPIDMSRRLFKRLRGHQSVGEGSLRIHDYGYDWRLSPHLLSKRFINFLEALPCNQPGTPPSERGAMIVAHSMGGIIVRHAVNQRPDLFSGVLYAGVPQHCVNILGPMRNGDEVLLSSKVLTAQVNFTMRSSYVLLPEDGHCFVDKTTGEEYPVDFFDIRDWEKYAFSPCVASVEAANTEQRSTLLRSISDALPIPGRKSQPTVNLPSSSNINTAASSNSALETQIRAAEPQMQPAAKSWLSSDCTIPHDVAVAYLKRTLSEVLRFRHELAYQSELAENNRYPPFAVLYANNTPTVAAARVTGRDAIRRSDAYDHLKFGSGDGVVLAKAAMLPSGYTTVHGGRIKTDRGHVGLLGDLEAVGRCLLALERGRRKHRVGLGHEQHEP